MASARNPSATANSVNEQDDDVSFHQERQQLDVEQKIQGEKKQGRMRRYINNRIRLVIGLTVASIFLAVPNLRHVKDFFIAPFGSDDRAMSASSAAFSTATTASLSNNATLSAMSVVANNNTNSIDDILGPVNDRSGISQKAHQNKTFQNHTTRTTGDNTTVIKDAISKSDATVTKPAAQALLPPQPRLPFQAANSTSAQPVANKKAPTTEKFVTTFDHGFYIHTAYQQTFPIDKVVQVVKGGGGGQLTTISVPPGIRNVQAVCEFQPDFKHSSHFPHTMQQIYACWSWWQHVARLVKSTQSVSSSSVEGITVVVPIEVQPILVVERDAVRASKHTRKQDAPFVPGLMDALEDSAFNLTIVEDMSSLSNSSSLMLVSRPGTSGPAFKVTSRLDAPSLRTAILSVLAAAEPTAMGAASQQKDKQIAVQAASALETESCKAGHADGGGFPRITILNRISNRRIINVDKFQSAIVALLKNNDNNTNTKTAVRVEHFEGRSFAEQVVIMANTDIIVSPHGAQLTSLPFMKTQPCGAVLELYPMGYWIPRYFGSLAAASGVNQHACIYLGDPVNRDKEVKIGSSTVEARVESRKRNIEVPINRTLLVVEQMIQSWRQCCAANVVAGSTSNV